MAVRVVDAPIKKLYGEQLSFTDVRTALNFRPGYSEILMEGTQAFRLGLGPKLVSCQFYNGGTEAYTDLTAAVSNADASTGTGTTMDSMATTSFLYVGAFEKFAGMRIDMTASPNGTESTMTVTYWNGSAWTDITATDGTKSGSTTLAIDGNVTWTVPATWAKTSVNGLGSFYWVRFAVSVALDIDTEIGEVMLLDADGASGEGYFKASTEYTMDINTQEAGSLNVIKQATNGTLNVTWIGR